MSSEQAAEQIADDEASLPRSASSPRPTNIPESVMMIVIQSLLMVATKMIGPVNPSFTGHPLFKVYISGTLLTYVVDFMLVCYLVAATTGLLNPGVRSVRYLIWVGLAMSITTFTLLSSDHGRLRSSVLSICFLSGVYDCGI